MTQVNTPVKLVVSLLGRVKDMRTWLCFLQRGACSSDPWGFCFVLLLLLVWFWFGWGFFVCLLAWCFRNKVLRYILCWSRICDVSQTGLELAVLLQLPRCWGYRPKVLTYVGQTTQSKKIRNEWVWVIVQIFGFLLNPVDVSLALWSISSNATWPILSNPVQVTIEATEKVFEMSQSHLI